MGRATRIWSGTSVALALACGGKSETHGDGSGSGAVLERTSSAEATRAFRDTLPEGARLLELRGNPNGTMNAEGTDTTWLAWAQDDATRTGFSAWVSTGGRGILVELGEVEYQECPGPGLVEVDSALVVPDALATMEALRLEPAEYVFVYYRQEALCLAAGGAIAPTGHLVEITRRGSDWQQYLFAHYDDAGRSVRFCGPCEDSGLQENCNVCAR